MPQTVNNANRKRDESIQGGKLIKFRVDNFYTHIQQ